MCVCLVFDVFGVFAIYCSSIEADDVQLQQEIHDLQAAITDASQERFADLASQVPTTVPSGISQDGSSSDKLANDTASATCATTDRGCCGGGQCGTTSSCTSSPPSTPTHDREAVAATAAAVVGQSNSQHDLVMKLCARVIAIVTQHYSDASALVERITFWMQQATTPRK
jgi:hypothetical protein